MPRNAATPEVDSRSATETSDDEAGGGSAAGFSDDAALRTKSESLGERLLGSLIDRAHIMPPRLLAPLLAQEIAAVGGREVSLRRVARRCALGNPSSMDGVHNAGSTRHQ